MQITSVQNKTFKYVPVKEFAKRYIVPREEMLAKEEGRVPVIRVDAILRLVNLLSLPISLGSDPTNFVPVKLRYDNRESSPMLEGIVPITTNAIEEYNYHIKFKCMVAMSIHCLPSNVLNRYIFVSFARHAMSWGIVP